MKKKQSTKNCKTLDEKTTLFAKLFALVDKELIRRWCTRMRHR